MGVTRGGRAWIGSYTGEGGPGIVAADVDPATGALTGRGVADALPQPSYLALADDASLLYAVSETEEEGHAAVFTTGAPGDAPVMLGEPVALGGAIPAHLVRVGRHLLVANYGSGSLTVLPLEADGSLSGTRRVVPFQGGGPHPERQRGPHAHQVLPDPSGRWIVSTDLGGDTVRVHALDASTGDLVPHHETVLRRGTGPRHLAFHPDGGQAYVLHELEPSLTVCRWDAGAGAFTPLGEVPLLPGGASRQSHASGIAVAHDGRFAWAANRGHDSISVLALDAPHGRAELVTTVPCGGRWPRDLALDPAGRRLYAANQHSGDVTWFDIAPETGIPAPAGSLAVPAAACVVFG